jgi:hypothetical protein
MTFRNPWIDPRVAQVRAAAARGYLLARGWHPLAAAQPALEPFENDPPNGGEAVLVHVPLREGARDYAQRVIELITELALAESRYAVEVLDDILRQPLPGLSAPANGAGTDQATAPAAP